MASPGPGKGCRPTKCAGISSNRPSARTSSIRQLATCPKMNKTYP